jgi:hypothetical protein
MSATALLGVRVGARVGANVGGSVGGRVDGAPRSPEVPVAPELLADLYEPHLIITADYVGPDPRYVKWARPRYEAAAAPLRQRLPARVLEILVVVLVTVAAVVPVTLIASQAVRGAPSPRPTIRIISAPPSSPPHASPAGLAANPIWPNSSGATPVVAAGAASRPQAQGASDRRGERAQSAADRRAERIARHAARARRYGSPGVATPAGH